MKNYPVLIIALIAAMFSSCEKVKDATAVSVTKTISMNIESDVFKVTSKADTNEDETNFFLGTETFDINDYPELKEYDIIDATINNVKVSISYDKEGDFFAYPTIRATGAIDVNLDENIIGKTIENNSRINSLARSTVVQLIDGKSVETTVLGTTNIPEGERVMCTMAIEVTFKVHVL
jgi:hypothetical protein